MTKNIQKILPLRQGYRMGATNTRMAHKSFEGGEGGKRKKRRRKAEKQAIDAWNIAHVSRPAGALTRVMQTDKTAVSGHM